MCDTVSRALASIVVGVLTLVAHESLSAQRPVCGTRTTAACTAPGLTFQTISAGFAHSCGVTSEGAAYCWGDGRKGALGNGRRQVSRSPQRVAGQYAFVEVGAGGDFTCARTADSQVLCWGGERPVPGWPVVSDVPRAVTIDKPAAAMAVGRRHVCILDSEGVAQCWGWNVDGETGNGTSGIDNEWSPRQHRSTPTRDSRTCRQASASRAASRLRARSGAGDRTSTGSSVSRLLPTAAAEIDSDTACNSASRGTCPGAGQYGSAGSSHVCVLTVSGRIFCWGSNGAGQVGAYGPGVPSVPVPSEVTIKGQGPFLTVTSGGVHSCALTTSRRVYCWGAYDFAGNDQAGAEALAPTLAAGGTQFRTISAGQCTGLRPGYQGTRALLGRHHQRRVRRAVTLPGDYAEPVVRTGDRVPRRIQPCAAVDEVQRYPGLDGQPDRPECPSGAEAQEEVAAAVERDAGTRFEDKTSPHAGSKQSPEQELRVVGEDDLGVSRQGEPSVPLMPGKTWRRP